MSLAEREQEIERTRERLNATIGRIQDKMTVSGVVDEVLGSGHLPAFETRYAKALDTVRANPVPVLLIAAGLGWALNRLAKRDRVARARLLDPNFADLPVNDGQARSYDPDAPGARSRTAPLDGRHGASS